MSQRHIELPSGNWVEVRENLKGRDKTAVHTAIEFVIEDGTQKTNAGIVDLMQNALLASIITGWSFAVPIPADSGGPDAVGDLDIDDHNKLTEETADLMKKVNFRVPN
jgi:hypothetical protein